ncbi:MAG: PQQ-binding-like beta-propeller repeat protein [Thermoplasmata archaeon]
MPVLEVVAVGEDIDREAKKLIKGLDGFLASKRISTAHEVADFAKTKPEVAKEVLPHFVALLKDGEDKVREALFQASARIAKEQPSLVKQLTDIILEYTDNPNPAIRRDAFLMLIHMGKDNHANFLYGITKLLDMVEGTSEEKKKAAAAVLEKIGLHGFSYMQTMQAAKSTLEHAESSGADLTKAKKLIQQARGQIKKGNYDGFNELISQARKVALNARRVVQAWKNDLKYEVKCCEISTDGKMCVVGTSRNEIICYDANGKEQWKYRCEDVVNDVDIFGIGKFIVATSADKNVYCLDGKGELKWKYRTGEINRGVSISADGEKIVVGGSSNIVYTLARNGAVIAKTDFVQGSPIRISQTEDGEEYAMVFGDHYTYVFDKLFKMKWKYMTGICAYVDIARNGERTASAGKGNFIFCFDRMGKLAWRYDNKASFGGVAVSDDGKIILGGSQKDLFCFDKDGKIIFKYSVDAPITDVTLSPYGHYIVVATKEGVHFLQNRDAYKQTTDSATEICESVIALKGEIGDAKLLFSKASDAFSEGDYKSGTEYAMKAEEVLKTSRLKRGLEAVSKAKEVLAEAVSLGADVSKCETLLMHSISALESERFRVAIRLADEALDLAREALKSQKERMQTELMKRSEEAENAILLALTAIKDALEFGAEVGEADSLVKRAVEIVKEGKFSDGIMLAEQAKNLAVEAKKKCSNDAANYLECVRKTLAKDYVKDDEAAQVKGYISKAKLYYEKIGDNVNLAKCYEYEAKLSEKTYNFSQAQTNYLKATSAYFKAGEFDAVLKLLLENIKKEEGQKVKREYIIQDIFVIYNDGRVIMHNSRRIRPDVDESVIGSMITAIQNFVKDSFQDVEAEELNELKYGATKILIERGQYIYIAVVISGESDEEFRSQIRSMLRNIESEYEVILSEWDGDVSRFKGIASHLSSLTDTSKSDGKDSLEAEVDEIAKEITMMKR